MTDIAKERGPERRPWMALARMLGRPPAPVVFTAALAAQAFAVAHSPEQPLGVALGSLAMTGLVGYAWLDTQNRRAAHRLQGIFNRHERDMRDFITIGSIMGVAGSAAAGRGMGHAWVDAPSVIAGHAGAAEVMPAIWRDVVMIGTSLASVVVGEIIRVKAESHLPPSARIPSARPR